MHLLVQIAERGLSVINCILNRHLILAAGEAYAVQLMAMLSPLFAEILLGSGLDTRGATDQSKGNKTQDENKSIANDEEYSRQLSSSDASSQSDFPSH